MAFYIVKPWYRKSGGGEKIWVSKTWTGIPNSFIGSETWTDGTDIYYSVSQTQLVLNRVTNEWENKSWSGSSLFRGSYIWKNNADSKIYLSNNTNQYELGANYTWNIKTWSGSNKPYSGSFVWQVGTNVFHSRYTSQGVAQNWELSGNEWIAKTWSGQTSLRGNQIWDDGTNYYYSYGTGTDTGKAQKVLNQALTGWDAKTWYGLTEFGGIDVWKDGNDIYYSSTNHYKLDKSTSTWSSVTWMGLDNLTNAFQGRYVWHDGNKTYYSNGADQYELVAA